MSSARNKVKEFFGQLAKERKSEEFYGFLGDRTGQVIADDYSNVWVLLYNGQVVLARNKVAPTVPRTPVAVGYTADDPKLLQVLRVLNVHDRSTTPYLPPHSKTHTWPGVDTVPIRAEQFLPGLAMPSGGMVVQYYGWPYKIGTSWHLANHSTHDFTSYIPDSGAIWVGVEIDASGVITYNSSTSKDSRDLLAPEDIAETPTDRRLLFAVKVYVGQTEVIKNELDTDLFDPRFAASSEGGGGGGTVESVTGDGVDNTDPANPVLTYPTPGDIGADVAGAAAAAQTAAEAYADSLVVGLWDDRGTFDASGGAYPSSGGSGTAGAIKKGDIWTVSVAGTLPTSQVVEVGDTVRALVDSPGNTQANWAIGQNNIGYVAENSANKATSMTGNETSNILYLTAKAVYDWATGLFVQKNGSITGATKTKITYDTKGLVTAGADATTADIADSSGKRYVPDSSASNDFLVGSGSAWVKKTLAETITILRTSLDSVYAALVHTHAASDIVSGTFAAARLPAPTTTDLGGVKRNTGTSGQFVTGIDSGGALTYDTPAGGGGDGWTAYSAVIPTRTVAADPTYTIRFSGVDLTGVLQEGTPIKWTQNSIVRYGGISSAPTYSGGNTTITILTRTDSNSANYDVLDTGTYAISAFAYGLPKRPGFGFPAYPEMWDIIVTVTTAYVKTSPTQNAWTRAMDSSLNLPSIDLPLGRWALGWSMLMYGEFTSGTRAYCAGTLSTSTSSESDKDLSNFVSFQQVGAGNVYIYSAANRTKDLVITTATTYYFLMRTVLASQTYIGVDNVVNNLLKAKCNYL